MIRSVRSYQLFCKAGYHARKIALIASRAQRQREIAARSRLRLEIVGRELALSVLARDRERNLQSAGVSSAVDAENAESALEQTRQLSAEVQANLFDQQLRIQDYEKAQLDLEHEGEERDYEFLLVVQESYKTLSSQISDWEQRYVIKAPRGGRVTLPRVWTSYEYMTTGTEVMAVLPDHTTLLGRIELGQQNLGKVAVGQRVNVMLDGYPFREFGVLLGTVQSIAPIAQAGSYVVYVSFGGGGEVRSSFGRRLAFKDGMVGAADIVTEEMRMIDRILGKLLCAAKQPGAR